MAALENVLMKAVIGPLLHRQPVLDPLQNTSERVKPAHFLVPIAQEYQLKSNDPCESNESYLKAHTKPPECGLRPDTQL